MIHSHLSIFPSRYYKVSKSKQEQDLSKSSNSKQIPNKRSFTLSQAILLVIVALIIGFLGGIKFTDYANKKYLGSNPILPMNMSQNPMPGSLGKMPPGEVKMDPLEAIQKMEQMLISDPKNLQILTHLGNLYYDTDNPQKAVETYEKALAINRNNPDVLTDCGIMYRQLKNYDKALAYFKEATQIAPSHFQSSFNMGIVYRDDLKQYQKAIDTWNQLLTHAPNSPMSTQVKAEIQKTKEMLAK